MELKEGVYVRTKKYGIAKIISDTKNGKFIIDVFKNDGVTLRCQKTKDISQASNNLIDLIEVGDYVNGHLISEIIDDEEGYDICYLDGGCFYAIDEIKDIVTKEQFNSMKYVVERDK